MLRNGYGEHNIQGIGDKHIPLIHNVMNTDLVIGVSDQAPTRSICCSTATSAASILRTRRQDRSGRWCERFDDIGLSGLANIVAAIKIAKHLDLGADDVS